MFLPTASTAVLPVVDHMFKPFDLLYAGLPENTGPSLAYTSAVHPFGITTCVVEPRSYSKVSGKHYLGCYGMIPITP